jgi:DNA-3-methyladenine glycosylase
MPPLNRIVQPLPRSFYERSPKIVARALLGKILIHRYAVGELVGRIPETEAYLGERDPASHVYHGKSAFKLFSLGLQAIPTYIS